MNGVAVIDTNLLVLLVVGSASRDFIAMHKRLAGYSVDEFDVLVEIIATFDEIVSVPHVAAEASNFLMRIKPPAQTRVMSAFQQFLSTTREIPVPSSVGAQRDEFHQMGLTDAVLLHLGNLARNEVLPTLVTVDAALANIASSLGHSVIDFKLEYMNG